MSKFEKGAEIVLPANGAAILSMKAQGAEAVTLNADDGFFYWNTSDAAAGVYYCRYLDGVGRCIKISTLEILKPFAEMSADDDPRSINRITLEAIDAALANRASAQQKKVQVGDRTIEYSSIDELMKWRRIYARRVAKEEGRSADLPDIKIQFGRNF